MKALALLRRIGALVAIGGGLAVTGIAPAAAQNDDLITKLLGGRASGANSGGGDWFGWGGGARQIVSFSQKFSPGQIIVSFGDRQLYLVTRKGEAIAYPIAVPREQSRWAGSSFVSMKRVNPPWTPTPTMRAENPRLPAFVPGGHPLNPLGVRGIYLGATTYRIHGTDAPWTIGQAVSKGCIRMYNEDVVDLYDRVRVGTRVTVTWNRFGT